MEHECPLLGMPGNAYQHRCRMADFLPKHDLVTEGAGEIYTQEPLCI